MTFLTWLNDTAPSGCVADMERGWSAAMDEVKLGDLSRRIAVELQQHFMHQLASESASTIQRVVDAALARHFAESGAVGAAAIPNELDASERLAFLREMRALFGELNEHRTGDGRFADRFTQDAWKVWTAARGARPDDAGGAAPISLQAEIDQLEIVVALRGAVQAYRRYFENQSGPVDLAVNNAALAVAAASSRQSPRTSTVVRDAAECLVDVYRQRFFVDGRGLVGPIDTAIKQVEEALPNPVDADAT